MAGTMTAAMVAGVVAPVATAAEESAFKDVPKGHWSADAINSMAAQGIIVGIGEGLFGFGQDVTRAQVATFMVKAKGIEAGSTKLHSQMYQKAAFMLNTSQLLKLTKLWLV